MIASLTWALSVLGMIGGMIVMSIIADQPVSKRTRAIWTWIGLVLIFGSPAAMVAYARHRVAHDPPHPPAPLPSCR